MTSILKKWVIDHRVHVLIWGIYIIWETVAIGLSFGVFGHPLTYIFHYILVILVFYLNAHFSLKWAFKNSSQLFFRLPVTFLFGLTLFVLASFAADLLLNFFGVYSSDSKVGLTVNHILRLLYRYGQFYGYSVGYYYLLTYLKEKRRSVDLEKQRLYEIIEKQKAKQELIRAQNAYLMAQINPHFFFNTLDYFYHNLRKISPELAEGISSLAGMMRFAINADKVGGVIRLGEELEQVQNLIYLHKIRQELFVELDFDEELEDVFLIPLLLLTVTENVFKHGILIRPDDPARIKIYKTGEHLVVETFNLINNIIRLGMSGTGLRNIKRRLAVAYGEHVNMIHDKIDDRHFFLKIEIGLHALNNVETFSNPLANTDIR